MHLWGSETRFGMVTGRQSGGDVVLVGESAEDLLPADPVLDEVNRFGSPSIGCPDLHISIDNLVIGDDRIAARWTLTGTGTDTGGLKGRPATGWSVRAWGVEHLALRDGKIISDWAGADWLGILIQLGVIPNPCEH